MYASASFAITLETLDLSGNFQITDAGANVLATAAGLDRLTEEEVELFQQNNVAYKEKCGFPFIICARLNKKEAILNGFKVRLSNSREQEIQAALAEIFKIAELRLQDLTHA